MPSFVNGIDAWDYVEADGTFTSLVTTTMAHLTAFTDGGTCRKDCTIPRCGDGIVDGGEVCDDGNNVQRRRLRRGLQIARLEAHPGRRQRFVRAKCGGRVLPPIEEGATKHRETEDVDACDRAVA